MIENINLWHADRGTYFDRNVNIISWSNDYHIHVGKYCSIGRDCNFFLHANHRPDWITTSSQLWGPVTPEIASMHMEMGHPSCKGNITIGSDVWIGAKSTIMSGVKIGETETMHTISSLYLIDLGFDKFNIQPVTIEADNINYDITDIIKKIKHSTLKIS